MLASIAPLGERSRGFSWNVTATAFAIGAQLGVGVATIVTSAAIYATAAVAFLCGDPAIGAAIGAVFGLVRAMSLLPARGVRDSESLVELHRRSARSRFLSDARRPWSSCCWRRW